MIGRMRGAGRGSDPKTTQQDFAGQKDKRQNNSFGAGEEGGKNSQVGKNLYLLYLCLRRV
jgi:hypothetical protein